MTRRHPSRPRLQRWLETGETRRAFRRIEQHIESCEVCQATLDEITELDDELVADLQTATTPPEDLTARTNEGVEDRLRNEAAIGVFLDLFTISWDLTRTVLDPTTEGEDAHPEPRGSDEFDGGIR